MPILRNNSYDLHVIQYGKNVWHHKVKVCRKQETQGIGINVNGNGNYIGVNQEQSSGIETGYPALGDDNNGNGYDSIQPGQANPSCKVVCLTIVR
jgi:hypothetical protein